MKGSRMPQVIANNWSWLKDWLPTAVTIGTLLIGLVAWGFSYGGKIKSNTNLSKSNASAIIRINREVIPTCQEHQQSVTLKLNTIQTIQKEQVKDVDKMDKKLDRILEKFISPPSRPGGS
jgi:hypothetical protein